MNTIKKLYKEFFGLNEETMPIPKIGDADIEQLEKYNDVLKQIKQTMAEEENIDEAQLINHIYDYRGGVEYVLRDPSQAKDVAAQIQEWTTKKA
jgi:inorganic pyrophosphatase/exopolyphosphatase